MPMALGLGQPIVAIDSNILEIKIPKEMEKAIPTGHAHMDRLFAGDGIIAGTVSLVTGAPGGGKTTLMVDVADKLMGMGHVAVYNTGEESLFQVRRVVSRMDLKNGFIPAYNMYAQDIIEHCEALRTKYKDKKIFLFQDSLQCIRVKREEGLRGRPASDEKQTLDGLQMLATYCKNNWIPFFLIGHINKKGDFAGKQLIKHIVDCHLHLDVDVDPETGVEERILQMQKNRFGASGTFYQAEMTEKGLKFESASSSMNAKKKSVEENADEDNEFGPEE